MRHEDTKPHGQRSDRTSERVNEGRDRGQRRRHGRGGNPTGQTAKPLITKIQAVSMKNGNVRFDYEIAGGAEAKQTAVVSLKNAQQTLNNVRSQYAIKGKAFAAVSKQVRDMQASADTKAKLQQAVEMNEPVRVNGQLYALVPLDAFAENTVFKQGEVEVMTIAMPKDTGATDGNGFATAMRIVEIPTGKKAEKTAKPTGNGATRQTQAPAAPPPS